MEAEGAGAGAGAEYVSQSANDQGEAEKVNQALAPPPECKSPSEVWRIAMEQGIGIPAALEDATRDLKKALQAEYMLNGKTEIIHDEKILAKYAGILGQIGKSLQNHILQGEAVIVDPNVQGIVDTYVSALDKSTIRKDLLPEYIRLHFHCFKSCNETNCLSFD